MLTSIGLVLESLISCARLRLNSKQRILVCRINGEGITELVQGLADELDCSVGCLWGNLRELREIGLVDGNELTELGGVVCSELRNLKGGDLK